MGRARVLNAPHAWEMTTLVFSPVLGSLWKVCTGTICESKRPLARAAAARAWLRAASVSCVVREMDHFSATFSEVTPMM